MGFRNNSNADQKANKTEIQSNQEGPNDYCCVVKLDIKAKEIKDPNILREKIIESILIGPNKNHINPSITFFKNEKSLKDLQTLLSTIPNTDPLVEDISKFAMTGGALFIVNLTINPELVRTSSTATTKDDFTELPLNQLREKAYQGEFVNLEIQPQEAIKNIRKAGIAASALQQNSLLSRLPHDVLREVANYDSPDLSNAIKIKNISSIFGMSPYFCDLNSVKLVADFSAPAPSAGIETRPRK